MIVRAALLLALFAACGDDAPGNDDAPEDAAPPGTACPAPATEPGGASPQFASAPAGVRIGASTYASSGTSSTQVRATLRTEPLPELHTVAQEDGACRRRAAGIYHCETPCAADALCTDENVCTTVGLGRSAGSLSVTVDDETTTLEPDATLTYRSEEVALGGCSPVTVTAAGADFPAFELEAALVPPIEITNLTELGYFSGEGLIVRWRPADPGARVRITFRADSASHGAVLPSILECDAPDDAGEIAVPASMMDPHIEQFGCGICPQTSVTRYRRAVTSAGATEVELIADDEQLLFLYPGGIELP